MLVKQIFDEELADIKIDKAFLKKLCVMESEFVNKKQEHIEFFGGTLTGVQVVRFTQEDRDKLFIDLLMVDDALLEERVYALKDKHGVPVIDQTRNVSSDIFNITCAWLTHAIENSRYLSKEEIVEGKIRICLYMLYRFITSLISHYYRYPADREIAQATYEMLSYKYILKQQGSWGRTLRFIAENSVSDKGIHAEFIKKMDVDYDLIRMLNDIQGRVRNTIKNITSEFHKVHNQGIRISSNNSTTVETDGEMVLKDKSKSLSNYTRYIKTVVADKNSFVKQELVDVVCNMMHTMPEKLFKESLEWTSTNYSHLTDNSIEKAIDMVMDHAFDYLSNHKNLLHHKADIGELISKLRGSYMSSRASDVGLMEAKEATKKLISIAVKTKNDNILSSIRTGWMIYVVLRAITMKHYST